MKLDSITFETPGGTTRNSLRIKRYDFSKTDKICPLFKPKLKPKFGMFHTEISPFYTINNPYHLIYIPNSPKAIYLSYLIIYIINQPVCYPKMGKNTLNPNTPLNA